MPECVFKEAYSHLYSLYSFCSMSLSLPELLICRPRRPLETVTSSKSDCRFSVEVKSSVSSAKRRLLILLPLVRTPSSRPCYRGRIIELLKQQFFFSRGIVLRHFITYNFFKFWTSQKPSFSFLLIMTLNEFGFSVPKERDIEVEISLTLYP